MHCNAGAAAGRQLGEPPPDNQESRRHSPPPTLSALPLPVLHSRELRPPLRLPGPKC